MKGKTQKTASRRACGILAAAACLGVLMSGAPAFAGNGGATQIAVTQGVNIYVDDRTFTPTDASGQEVPALIYGGATYLPARAVSQVFGAEIRWDAASQTVYIGRGTEKTENETPFRAQTAQSGRTVWASEVQVCLDGRPYEPADAAGHPAPALLINGTTYLPARALCGFFGFPIAWDPYSGSVFIGEHMERVDPGTHQGAYQIEGQKTLNYCALLIRQIEYNCAFCKEQEHKVYDVAYNKILTAARGFGLESERGRELMALYGELEALYSELIDIEGNMVTFELESLYQIEEKKQGELSAIEDDYDMVMFNKFIDQCMYSLERSDKARMASLDSELAEYSRRADEIIAQQ